MRDASSWKNDKIELSLPADKNLMLVVRLTTAGVVARAGLTLDELDDVKLAVEEACLCLLEGEAKELRLSFALRPGEICVEISRDGAALSALRLPAEELEVVRCILESLVRAVEFRVDAQGISAICLHAGLAG